MEIVLEYCALSSAKSDVKSVIENILDDLEFGKKTGAQLQEKIDRNLTLMGQEGLAAKYDSHQQFYDIEESFGIELESLIDEGYSGLLPDDEPEFIPYGEKEQYNFDKFETVPVDAHKIYTNKIINFGSVLTLGGKLTFKNCTILYNIPQQLSKISCSDNASIEFYDCEIKCIEKRDNFFIDADSAESTTLNIIRCKIIEGFNFYCCDDEGAITRVNDSVITNPIKRVIYSWRGKLYFENTKINITDAEGCMKISGRYHDDLFCSNNIDIKNCIISCEWPEDYEIRTHTWDNPVHYSSVFRTDNLKLTQSSLVEIKHLIGNCDNVEIDRCDFYKCFHLTSSDRVMTISNSNFIKNKYLNLELGQGSKLSFCHFIDSEGKIIESGYNGGVLIDGCEFYNSVSTYNSNVLEFNRSDDASSSIIKNSIFKGIKVSSKNSYSSESLIKAYATEEKNKWVLNIENCVFSNISGTDLFQDKQTFTSWIFSDTEVTTISYKNCIGLDQKQVEASISIPDLGVTGSAKILAIHIKTGDVIAVGNLLAELETDKAVMEIPADVAGRITGIALKVGDNVSQGAVIGTYSSIATLAQDGTEKNIPYRMHTSEGGLIGSSLVPDWEKSTVVENGLETVEAVRPA
jgi:hypothetical protein